MTTVVTSGLTNTIAVPSNLPPNVQYRNGIGRRGYWSSAGGSAVSNVGLNLTATGTIAAPTIASTNLFTSMQRGNLPTAATAGGLSGLRQNVLNVWRGNAANLGGFYVSATFGIADAALVAGAITFVGLYGTASHPGPTVSPLTLLNVIGIGHEAADTNFSIFHNDGTGSATKISLGANFPSNTISTDMYRMELFAAPNGSSVTYRVTRLNTGGVATGVISTDLPANNVFLGFQTYRANNATAAAATLAHVSYVVESDY